MTLSVITKNSASISIPGNPPNGNYEAGFKINSTYSGYFCSGLGPTGTNTYPCIAIMNHPSGGGGYFGNWNIPVLATGHIYDVAVLTSTLFLILGLYGTSWYIIPATRNGTSLSFGTPYTIPTNKINFSSQAGFFRLSDSSAIFSNLGRFYHFSVDASLNITYTRSFMSDFEFIDLFESGISNWSGDNANTALLHETGSAKYEGTGSVRFWSTTTSSSQPVIKSVRIPVPVGAVHVWASGVVQHNGGGRTTLTVRCYDASNTLLLEEYSSTQNFPSQGVYRIENEFVILPANTTEIEITLLTGNVVNSQLQYGDEVTVFFNTNDINSNTPNMIYPVSDSQFLMYYHTENDESPMKLALFSVSSGVVSQIGSTITIDSQSPRGISSRHAFRPLGPNRYLFFIGGSGSIRHLILEVDESGVSVVDEDPRSFTSLGIGDGGEPLILGDNVAIHYARVTVGSGHYLVNAYELDEGGMTIDPDLLADNADDKLPLTWNGFNTEFDQIWETNPLQGRFIGMTGRYSNANYAYEFQIVELDAGEGKGWWDTSD